MLRAAFAALRHRGVLAGLAVLGLAFAVLRIGMRVGRARRAVDSAIIRRVQAQRAEHVARRGGTRAQAEHAATVAADALHVMQRAELDLAEAEAARAATLARVADLSTPSELVARERRLGLRP